MNDKFTDYIVILIIFLHEEGFVVDQVFTETLLVRSDTMDGFEYTENCLNERGKQDLQFWFYKFYGKFYQK